MWMFHEKVNLPCSDIYRNRWIVFVQSLQRKFLTFAIFTQHSNSIFVQHQIPSSLLFRGWSYCFTKSFPWSSVSTGNIQLWRIFLILDVKHDLCWFLDNFADYMKVADYSTNAKYVIKPIMASHVGVIILL